MNKTVRDAIRDLLVEHVPSVKDEVWEPGAADGDIPKPFLVVREGIGNEPNSFDSTDTTFEVWPYVERESLTDLDNLIQEVLQAINYAIIVVDQVPHYLQYTGTGTEDMIIEDWEAYTKSMNFDVIALDWRTHSEIEPDPIDGMVKWVDKHFDYQTNPREWLPSDDEPAVYWRQTQVTSVEPMNWGGFINAQLRGHVISPSLEVRKKATEQLVRKLMVGGHTHLSDGSVMLFRGVASNDGYNPFIDGQIILNVRYGVLNLKQNTPIRNVYASDERVKGELHYDEE